ncbi:MAG: response regulator transcription factor [Lachnospiraceae bacterium]|nr:response regulator transcription factor [Lachnospiraceae bacterium]
MYKIAMCDDEKEILKNILEKIKLSFDKKDIQATYYQINDSRALMELLQKENLDVLFLDIDMPYLNGMDIAGYINEQGLHTILVFVTSHDALVYQTFAYRPFGFIRKSFIEKELDELTERIKRELIDRKQELILAKGTEIVRILIKDIVYIESEGNYLNIYTHKNYSGQIASDANASKSHVIKYRETMTNMEKELVHKGFIRCHKGYLVNEDYIEKFKSSEIEIKYKEETKLIPVGRSYEKDVRKKMLIQLRK